MIFYYILFYLIILEKTIFGMFDMDFSVQNECSIRLETDHGIETCLNHQCYYYKDPWRVLSSHYQDEPCYIHYLKLSFSNYDQFLIFSEMQHSYNLSLNDFFAANDMNLNVLDIEIDTIYPFIPNYLLSNVSLFRLGGVKSEVDLLKIEIKKWYNSARNALQIIDNLAIHKQPFDQIIVYYQCNQYERREILVLAKYSKIQSKSKCPKQIQIISNENIYLTEQDIINIQTYQPRRIHPEVNNTNIQHYNTKQSNLFIKVCLIF